MCLTVHLHDYHVDVLWLYSRVLCTVPARHSSERRPHIHVFQYICSKCRLQHRIFPIISRPFYIEKSFERVRVDLHSGIFAKIAEKTMTRMKIHVAMTPMKQMMLGRQTACMCVSVDSSHENCTYHIHKIC